jgi:DNA-binding NtrC family response regulator
MSTLIPTTLNTNRLNETDGVEARIAQGVSQKRARILVVDADQAFCESLAQELTAEDCEVLTAETGRRAFSLLRNWQNPIGWLYTRAVLDSLIDGRVLADEYHSTYPERPVIIAASDARSSASGDIILKDPTPSVVSDAIRRAIGAAQPAVRGNLGSHLDAA